MVLSRTFDNLLFWQIVWHSCPVVTLSRKNKYLQGHEKGHVLALCDRRDFLRTDIGYPGRQILGHSKEAFSTNKSCLKASRLPRVGDSWFPSPERAYKLARVARERSPVLVPNLTSAVAPESLFVLLVSLRDPSFGFCVHLCVNDFPCFSLCCG